MGDIFVDQRPIQGDTEMKDDTIDSRASTTHKSMIAHIDYQAQNEAEDSVMKQLDFNTEVNYQAKRPATNPHGLSPQPKRNTVSLYKPKSNSSRSSK